MRRVEIDKNWYMLPLFSGNLPSSTDIDHAYRHLERELH